MGSNTQTASFGAPHSARNNKIGKTPIAMAFAPAPSAHMRFREAAVSKHGMMVHAAKVQRGKALIMEAEATAKKPDVEFKPFHEAQTGVDDMNDR